MLAGFISFFGYIFYDSHRMHKEATREFNALSQTEIIQKYGLNKNRHLSSEELANLVRDYELKKDNFSELNLLPISKNFQH